MALPPITGRAPVPSTASTPATDARSAAQRAFFQAALAKTGAAAAPAAPTRALAPQAAPAARESRAVQPAVTRVKDETVAQPQPGRILRPGSIVDIKV